MFDRICTALELGMLTAPVVRLTGGFSHRMFRLTTTAGDFAVKLLSPEVMQRPDALDHYRTAEAFEALLEAADLPILPAKRIHRQKMQLVDGQYLYVFDYMDGHALSTCDITPGHCAQIGSVLAQIHGLSSREPANAAAFPSPIDWSALAEALLADADAHSEGLLLRDAVSWLEDADASSLEALRRLPPTEALCHNDMDPKNVLWAGDAFRIIDLECLGYADPRRELLELAVAWSEDTAHALDEQRFRAFVTAYIHAGGVLPADPAAVYDSSRTYLDWLAFNARRTLFDTPEERSLGREQVRYALEKLEADRRNRASVLQWLA